MSALCVCEWAVGDWWFPNKMIVRGASNRKTVQLLIKTASGLDWAFRFLISKENIILVLIPVHHLLIKREEYGLSVSIRGTFWLADSYCLTNLFNSQKGNTTIWILRILIRDLWLVILSIHGLVKWIISKFNSHAYVHSLSLESRQKHSGALNLDIRDIYGSISCEAWLLP